MKVVYIPEDFHLIVNCATKTLSHNYDDDSVNLDNLNLFELINIIFKMEKDEICLSSMLNHDLSKFTIVETQNNYYISIGLYTACEIAFNSQSQSEFSENLYNAMKNIIPDIFDKDKMMDYFKRKARISTHNISYSHKSVQIMDDVLTMGNSYMWILTKYNDLDKKELNKLFRITAKFIIPLYELLEFKSMDRLVVMNNLYNFYYKRFIDSYPLSSSHIPVKTITSYLKCISDEDEYTSNNIPVEFKTSVVSINKFSHGIIRTYAKTMPEVTNILPMSTMTDVFVSISLDDINRYSTDINILRLKRMLLFKNKPIQFALNSEGDRYD